MNVGFSFVKKIKFQDSSQNIIAEKLSFVLIQSSKLFVVTLCFGSQNFVVMCTSKF